MKTFGIVVCGFILGVAAMVTLFIVVMYKG